MSIKAINIYFLYHERRVGRKYKSTTIIQIANKPIIYIKGDEVSPKDELDPKKKYMTHDYLLGIWCINY